MSDPFSVLLGDGRGGGRGAARYTADEVVAMAVRDHLLAALARKPDGAVAAVVRNTVVIDDQPDTPAARYRVPVGTWHIVEPAWQAWIDSYPPAHARLLQRAPTVRQAP